MPTRTKNLYRCAKGGWPCVCGKVEPNAMVGDCQLPSAVNMFRCQPLECRETRQQKGQVIFDLAFPP